MTLTEISALPDIDLRGPAGRWQPYRAGVVHVWQYAEETLEFEDGRLLLFGANGSGKTMLLELLLPYLLDAKGQPGRLSTSGADRGGLWDRVVGYESGKGRTGYLWITFARQRAGKAEHFSCGSRLKAKPSGGGEHTWFTTSLVPGVDLELLDRQRRPLDVEALTCAIAEHGTVWGKDTAGYRDAVRTTLFSGFSPLRLEALIASLLVVRKQSVTDGLSADKLNELLREGLPPLDDDEVAKLARGFEELDRRREQITTMAADLATARAVRQAARSYAQAVVAAHADTRVSTETKKDNVTREEREANQKLADAVKLQQEVADELETVALELARVDGRLTALRGSEAFRTVGALETLQQLAESARVTAEQANRRMNDRQTDAADERRAADTLAGEEATARRQLDSAKQELLATATEAAVEVDETLGVDSLTAGIAAQVDALKRAVREVRTALRRYDAALTERRRDEEAVQSADGKLTVARDNANAATRDAGAALRRWRSEIATWAESLEELDRDQLATVTLDADEPETVHTAAQAAYADLAERLATRRQQLDTAHDTLATERSELDRERARLVEGGIERPPAPATRRERTDLPGAPLWELVAFAEHVDDELAARLEAAVGEAGLLDAWVHPDGHVEIESPDVVLAPTPAAPEQPSLTEVLHPEAHPHVAACHVVAILERVGWADTALTSGPATLTLGTDGTWRAGPLHGRAATGSVARYIGATSRERNRLARIAELHTDIGLLDHALEENTADLTTLEARRATAAGERDRVKAPAEDTLREARQTASQRDHARELAATALAEAEEALETSSAQLQHELRALNQLGSGYSLPTDPTALDRREEAYDRALRQAGTLDQRYQRVQTVSDQARQAAQRAGKADERAGEARTEHRDATRRAEELQARYREMERTSGSDARKVLEDIAGEEDAKAGLQQRQEDAREQQRKIDRTVATAEQILLRATDARELAEQRRDEAHTALVRLFATGLATDAGFELEVEPTTITASHQIAQQVRARVSNLDRSAGVISRALSRLEEQVFQASAQLSGRADLSVATEEDGAFSSLTARVDGVPLRAPVLEATFTDRLAQAQRELSKREERIFEETLTGALRDHLASRIRSATTTVRMVNQLLERIRTAAGGVKVQLRWDVDGDEVDDQVLLGRIMDLLLGRRHEPEEQAELHAFLRRQIDKVRAADDDSGNWPDRLARVLDYRRWHRFTVLVHHDRFADKPIPFGSRKVTLSAGEKTVALTVPLIAAIAAHYLPRDGGDTPACPRLLLMDELFPKVDRPNKRMLLGLVNDLGLDVVFTSDKDWCDYDTLDTIAIHVVQKDGDASLTTRFVWNGNQRAPSPLTRPAGTADRDLFDGLSP